MKQFNYGLGLFRLIFCLPTEEILLIEVSIYAHAYWKETLEVKISSQKGSESWLDKQKMYYRIKQMLIHDHMIACYTIFFNVFL